MRTGAFETGFIVVMESDGLQDGGTSAGAGKSVPPGSGIKIRASPLLPREDSSRPLLLPVVQYSTSTPDRWASMASRVYLRLTVTLSGYCQTHKSPRAKNASQTSSQSTLPTRTSDGVILRDPNPRLAKGFSETPTSQLEYHVICVEGETVS